MRARRRPDRVLSIEVKRIFAKKGRKKTLKKSERARKASQRQLCIMHLFALLCICIIAVEKPET